MFRGCGLLWQLTLLGLLIRPVSDETAAHAGRELRRYQRKQQVVKGIWFASGLMMLAFPIADFMVTLGLFTTFLCFSILDESA